MIHPHLYGLQAMSGGNAMVHSFEPVVSSSSGSTKQSGDVGKCGGSPQKEDVGSPESKPSHPGGLFQHLNSASSDWDIFGKSPNSKFVLNSTGQSNENSISMADWSTSNHQVCFLSHSSQFNATNISILLLFAEWVDLKWQSSVPHSSSYKNHRLKTFALWISYRWQLYNIIVMGCVLFKQLIVNTKIN